MPDINYAVRDPEMEQMLGRLGTIIGNALPDNWGFTLMLFNYGPGGNMFYISSADRADIMKVMQEFIDRNKM